MIELLLTLQIDNFSMLDYNKQKVLNAIKLVESRNCQNTNHKTMKRGLHKGESAKGCYGMMPKTIKTVLDDLENEKDIMTSLSSPNALNRVLDLDYVLAARLYDKLDKRYHGDTKKIVYSWLNGSLKRGYKKHWYVRRVLNNY